MGSTDTGINDDSATISDDSNTKTDSDSDSDSETETDEDSAIPPASRGQAPFEVGEKVLAIHTKQIYEAKVVQIEYRFKDWRYFVHYAGWNKSWDEWVGQDRLLKFNEENVQKQQALKQKADLEKNTKAGASQIKPKSSGVMRGKKRRKDSFNKEKGDLPLEKLMSLQIPATLKKQLLDDCEFVTHLGKLVKLPRIPNVDGILKKYLYYRSKKDGSRAESVGEILNGLRCYFDKALPVMLLYKSERKQYVDAIKDNNSPSEVYGAEHLLRLFVNHSEICDGRPSTDIEGTYRL